MKLCTFEVRTHLGRHQRVGAVTDAGIIDLNFACAALLGGNYRLADGVPRSGRARSIGDFKRECEEGNGCDRNVKPILQPRKNRPNE